jgi:DNA-binding MarR family transcriptional regulator
MVVKQTRRAVLKELNEALRKVSAQSVLLSDTVAKLVRVNSTDLECLDLLMLAGITTAGQLAAHTGLTTGAMTAVIDRLERAGFVRRRRDPEDRRRVLVEALPRGLHEIGPLYRPLAESSERLSERYDDKELALVVDYLTRSFALVTEHVAWLQTQRPVTRRARHASRDKGATEKRDRGRSDSGKSDNAAPRARTRTLRTA